jgi:hypothetical protein
MLGTILKEIVSQKRIAVFLLALFVVLLCNAVLLPAKDNPMGIKDKQDIMLSAPTLVGGTVLPAGDYKVTHEMQGQTHIMIFKQSHGTAEVKTKCTLVPLNEKAQDTRQLYETNAKNQKVLMEMIFRGDTAKHVLEQ